MIINAIDKLLLGLLPQVGSVICRPVSTVRHFLSSIYCSRYLPSGICRLRITELLLVMEPEDSPVHPVKSKSSPTYAEIVGNNSPLRNSWWLRYQSQEEEEALTLALQKSLEEKQVISNFARSRLRNISRIIDAYFIYFRVTLTVVKMCLRTPLHLTVTEKRRLTSKGQVIGVVLNLLHDLLRMLSFIWTDAYCVT